MHFFVLAFALISALSLALASPIPLLDGMTVHLEKRITHVGRGTWFHVGKGNCGAWNNDGDLIVAIPKSLYDKNGGSNCDQWIEIVNVDNGRKVYAMTRDSCPSCGPDDLDMSPSTFKGLTSLDAGVVTVKWHFMQRGWSP